MAGPGKTASIEIIQDVVITETAGPRSQSPQPQLAPPPPPPPEARGAGSVIEITTADQSGSTTMTAVNGPNMNVRTTVSNEGTNMQVTTSDGNVRNINVPPIKRSSSNARFERRILVVDGNETMEEYENGRLVKKTINGKEQPLQ
ncbi:uncharacterized protein LOC135367829 [Ornithodoros turicata]|uniref:uncharacterized protein LOC135367829 n=1 Tax=Ornithodoros turicata TaxID=34597 RepID=UPI00313A2A34